MNKQNVPHGAPPSSHVAREVRRHREAREMTYVGLSARLEEIGSSIPVLGLRRIERGERRVDVDDLAALAQVFGVEPWSLTRPPACDACLGSPPAGFTCNTCGTTK